MTTIPFSLVTVSFSRDCAWRAVYVKVLDRQVLHVGIDPTASRGAEFFGGTDRSLFRVRLSRRKWYSLDGRNSYYRKKRLTA